MTFATLFATRSIEAGVDCALDGLDSALAFVLPFMASFVYAIVVFAWQRSQNNNVVHDA